MTELKDFFGASVGAAGALIGLLFVAVTLAPEKVFGPSAESLRRGQAIGAFTALANVFFVSLAALIPDVAAPIVIAFAIIDLADRSRKHGDGACVCRTARPASLRLDLAIHLRFGAYDCRAANR